MFACNACNTNSIKEPGVFSSYFYYLMSQLHVSSIKCKYMQNNTGLVQTDLLENSERSYENQKTSIVPGVTQSLYHLRII